MSPCHQTYLRCASLALFLALVLTALPALLNAQTAPAPKAPSQPTAEFPTMELFVGYQWYNPGGNVPDQSVPPNPFKLPSIAPGVGTSLSYNFTRNFALEGDYGVDWNKYATVNTVT
ncbi:MAG: hypothetical protein WAJ97_08120, partial [Terriglobales bacterium]